MAYTFIGAIQAMLGGNIGSDVTFSLASTLFYIALAVVVERVAWRYVRRYIEGALKDSRVFKPVERVVSFSMLLVMFSVILYVIGFSEILAIVGGAGLFFSIFLGFSMRIVMENFIAGLIIFVSDEVKVGDRITMPQVSGADGIVTERGMRYTILRDRKGNKVKLPNSMIVTNAIIKYKK